MSRDDEDGLLVATARRQWLGRRRGRGAPRAPWMLQEMDKPSDWGSAAAAGARGSGTRWEAARSSSPLIRARGGEDRAGRGRRRWI